MKKNGYTLIELIAVIAIIALIATIVILSFDNTIGKSKDKKVANFKNDLEKAACVYIDLNEASSFKSTCYPSRSCVVTASQLIESGILSDDLVDPVTENKIDPSITISVTWDNQGSKTCTFNR